MSPERIWYGKDAAALLLRGLLLPLSGLYWLGWQTYLAIYKLGLKKQKEPHRPVICVGNMTVGGSGKSPTTLYVAMLLKSLGRQVVIGASGYGSPASEAAAIAPDGELNATRWGDEPAMIRWLLPDVPLIVGRNRVKAARLCQEHFPGAVLLMDDGLQHLPLRRHLSIALDSGSGNRFVLPAGPYREPASNLGRVDAVVISGDNPAGGSLCLTYAPAELYLVAPKVSPDTAGGHIEGRVAVLTAIARPERLLQSLESLGLDVTHTKLLPDHHPMTAGNLLDGLPPELPLIVTAKDWVKLRERADIGARSVVVAMRQAAIEPEAEFKNWLLSKLDEQA